MVACVEASAPFKTSSNLKIARAGWFGFQPPPSIIGISTSASITSDARARARF
jgi:hypothetical protein